MNWVQWKVRVRCHLHNKESDVVFSNYVAERKDADDKEEGSKDKALGYTKGKGGKLG